MSGIMKVVFSHEGDSSVGMDCRSFECEFDFDCWERGEVVEFLEQIAGFLQDGWAEGFKVSYETDVLTTIPKTGSMTTEPVSGYANMTTILCDGVEIGTIIGNVSSCVAVLKGDSLCTGEFAGFYHAVDFLMEQHERNKESLNRLERERAGVKKLLSEMIVESFRDNKLTSESLKSLNEKISDLIRSDF